MASVAIGARSIPAAPAPVQPWARTSASAYTLRITDDAFSVDLPVTFRNLSGGALYGDPCGHLFLQQWTTEGWRGALWWACALPGGVPPDTIAAGAVIAETLRVVSHRRPRTYPRFEVEPIPGTYRLVYGLYRRAQYRNYDWDLSEPLSLDNAASNNFTIGLP